MPTNLPPVFFEMLRSFVSLAKTLNISHSAKELNITRHTIKRHIAILERLKGCKFFRLTNRQYHLTLEGTNALVGAQSLLLRAQTFLDRDFENVEGLSSSKHEDNGTFFYAQRHSATSIATQAPHLIQEGLASWGQSNGYIENAKMKKIRPYLVIYRRRGPEWVCVEIGEKSSYATWLGWSWAKSAIGCTFDEDPTKSTSDTFMLEAYDTVFRSGSIWYDHVSTQLTRIEGKDAEPVNYQRLLMACLFPNGETAVAALVVRTNNIHIENISETKIRKMADEYAMDIAI